ncbi:hypothetical protein PG999_013829 [Apiospora kogelbergensis]|uniref:60S ribosomal protein L41 n=1 Tax=Apiospora kogelbergensis TaxID=1337665 RepID=A0AAW0Q983_9PEZI
MAKVVFDVSGGRQVRNGPCLPPKIEVIGVAKQGRSSCYFLHLHSSPARIPDSQPYLEPAKTFAGPHHPRKPGALAFWTWAYIGNSCPPLQACISFPHSPSTFIVNYIKSFTMRAKWRKKRVRRLKRKRRKMRARSK